MIHFKEGRYKVRRKEGIRASLIPNPLNPRSFISHERIHTVGEKNPVLTSKASHALFEADRVLIPSIKYTACFIFENRLRPLSLRLG